MKANIGSFAAALRDKNVWVMNTISEDGPNTLKIIYDRGLIGAVHNWYVSNDYINSRLKSYFGFNTFQIEKMSMPYHMAIDPFHTPLTFFFVSKSIMMFSIWGYERKLKFKSTLFHTK